MEHVYAGLGDNGRKLYLFEADRKTKIRQVLWGDWLNVDGEEADGWLRIIWAPKSPAPRTMFIPKADTVATRPLEIVFLDVGQGDGAVLITPETDDREGVIVIDAGKGDNMARFLAGRFKAYRTGFNFDSAVITHPDSDHYKGFGAIFAEPKIGFKCVWHSGLVERPVQGTWDKIGAAAKDPVSKITYQTELAVDTAAVEALFADPALNAKFVFPTVIQAAIDNPKVGAINMLSTRHGTLENGRSYMPGYAPSDARGYSIEVLGPVVEPDATDVPRLRRLGSYGETKNGHSVLLRLVFGQFSIFFGGDLNEPAERFLLMHYAGLTRFPLPGSVEYRAMVAAAATRFRSDVMKVCHHGSDKVTDAFLEAVNPASFIISSGDEEGHVHPRPSLLGRLGKLGRGASPVLLSTELQRSTRESEDRALIERIKKNIDKLAAAPGDALKAALAKDIATLAKTNVDVYGAIYLKTDGHRLITAFKIEAQSDKDKWFYYEYVFLPNGELILID